MSSHWKLDDIPWSDIQPDRVDRELLEAVKAAALVEANSADYVRYLHNVFAADESFKLSASQWGREERQHGDALGQWAQIIDPSFEYEYCLRQFRFGYQIPLEAGTSVRGSCAGELVARCVVESGTCSFYSALRDRSEEPVLKRIAGFIAQDEARHYHLFKSHLQRHLEDTNIGMLERCRIAYKRVAEVDDDELAYAYYSANIAPSAIKKPYERLDCARAYSARTLKLYEFEHVRSAAHMILGAVDLKASSRLAKVCIWIAWKALQWHTRRLRRVALTH
tara:strand:+ start:90 stop:926 length:837 start_codon:yes stop_codon:yes gene_type:complete